MAQRKGWHHEAADDLLGFRSTPDLPPTADVVIIGSGITGAFAAHFLKKSAFAADASVVMLEAREACWGATGRNGGHCQPLLYASAPDVARFELATFAFLEDLVHDQHISCDWRTLDGGVHAFLTADVFAAARRLADGLTARHPDLAPFLRVVDGATAAGRRQLAALRVPAAAGALVHARAASLSPYRLVAALLRALLRAHPPAAFNLQTGTPATALRRTSSPPPPSSSSAAAASCPWHITTPRGPLRATKVLLATNGYTSHLAATLTDLVVPVRGQVAALLPPASPLPAAAAARLAHGYVLLGRDRNEYLTQHPRRPREFVFGGGRQLAALRGVGVWRDDAVEPAVAAYLRRELGAHLDLSPRAAGAAPAEEEGGEEEEEERGTADDSGGGGDGELEASFEWTGVMGYSRDRRPWVGAVPAAAGGGEGLFVCAGYSGHGMPVAPLCAREVVRMMAGGEAEGEAGGERVMPASFVVSEARIAQARREPEVHSVDELGLLAAMEQLYVELQGES